TLLLVMSAGAIASSQTMPHLTYPPAPKGTQTDTYHGVAIADPHRELESADSTATRQWVDRENELTRSYLDKVPGRDAIRKSLTELWNYEKFRGLMHWGNRYFYSHNTGLQN